MNSTFDIIIEVIVSVSVAALFIAVFIDFYLYQSNHDTKHNKKSIVATGSMFAFYLVYFIVLRFKFGSLPLIPRGFL
jgi:phosphotransferase system  glucose/maltose/N-acetylglucosamine-specific IIC component